MIELKYGRFGLFLAHMHSRYHESSKTHKKLFFVRDVQKSCISLPETVSMLIWKIYFSYYHLETEKNPFHHFESIKSSHLIRGCVLEDSWYRLCMWAKKSPKRPYFNSIMSGFGGFKTMKRLFSFFKLNYGKKPFECTVLQLRGTKCGSYKQFWKLTIFEIFWQNSNLLKIRPKFRRFPGINYFSILRLI